MARVRKRGKANSWEIEVYLGRDPVTGKKRFYRETFRGTKTQAKLRASELEVNLKRAPGAAKAPATVGECLDRWLAHVRGSVAETTFENYSVHARRLKPYVGRLPLWGLTPGALQEALSPMWEKFVPTTCRKTVGTLKTCLRQAVAWGWVSRDPTQGLKLPRVARSEKRVLAPGELTRLLEALKGYKHGLAVRVLAVAGLRLGEVLALRWEDVDFEKGTVTVRRSADSKRRKLKEDTKTPAARRTIRLDAETLRLLEEHKRSQKVRPLKDALVFPAEDGRPLRCNAVRKTLRLALKKAGLPRIRVHDLRHTAASILIDAGVSLTTVAAFLGHSSPATTAAIYAHAVRRADSVAGALESGSESGRKPGS
ncbi:MAG: Integrase family protein [Thermoanaerobacterales bacterium 50_218]|nr:MAG: Integrase family protein [Thermoanaerobacterales bacterium 50_218]